MHGTRGALVALAGVALCAACTSSGAGAARSYKTITCAEYVELATADDALSNGSLNMANDYLDSTPVDPKGGAADVAAFEDQIVSSCDTATGDTPIVQLRARVVSVFLARHPRDRA